MKISLEKDHLNDDNLIKNINNNDSAINTLY